MCSGFDDVVLWNIWEEGAKGMGDLGEGEWQKYICVEAGQIGEKVADVRADALKAVEKHRLAAEGRDVRLAEKRRKK